MKRYAYFLVVAFIALTFIWWWTERPETVTLDSKHWGCDVAVVDGLHTKCTVYSVKTK